MLAAAARRGVDVRVLTAGPLTDVAVVRSPVGPRTSSCSQSGVRIYEWRPTTLHAKTFVIDGEWATIGSMNFDNRSLALNDEATLMVRDRTFGHRMDEIFMADLANAEAITAERSVSVRGLNERQNGLPAYSDDCCSSLQSAGRVAGHVPASLSGPDQKKDWSWRHSRDSRNRDHATPTLANH